MSLIILDYGIGNLRSVQKAFQKVGSEAIVSSDLNLIATADRLVLPGVGAFADCMDKFTAAGLKEPVLHHLQKGKPFLGICVGMQMLFTTGYENGTHAGLGIFPGTVDRFPMLPGYKIPHMGWNQTRVVGSHQLWQALPQPAWFYFVHSYHCVPEDRSLIALETDYMQPFCSAIQQGRLMATQFHPEKSQAAGLTLLQQFMTL
jgi:imidazole glycerol-phosphate synthase subunit HisH